MPSHAKGSPKVAILSGRETQVVSPMLNVALTDVAEHAMSCGMRMHDSCCGMQGCDSWGSML